MKKVLFLLFLPVVGLVTSFDNGNSALIDTVIVSARVEHISMPLSPVWGREEQSVFFKVSGNYKGRLSKEIFCVVFDLPITYKDSAGAKVAVATPLPVRKEGEFILVLKQPALRECPYPDSEHLVPVYVLIDHVASDSPAREHKLQQWMK